HDLPRRAVQSSHLEAGGDPLSCSLFQTKAVPRASRPHTLSLFQTVVQVPLSPSAQQGPGFKVLGGGPFVPNPAHTQLQAAAVQRVVPKARSHSIRKVWKPLSFSHPSPETWLGAGAGRSQGGPKPALWVCFDW
uniref:Uncharacterized protein n=1 Tax=Moschus moschiferus TaxID=68415 RepID=A0A8C6CRP6_MOSMO